LDKAKRFLNFVRGISCSAQDKPLHYDKIENAFKILFTGRV